MRTVEVPGEVDSMLMESGMLFVGLHQSVPGKQTAEYLTTVPGSILVYNLQAGSEHALPGHMVSFPHVSLPALAIRKATKFYIAQSTHTARQKYAGMGELSL